MTRNIIRRPEVKRRTGLSDTTIWRQETAGNFPERIQLSEKSVGWFEDEITQWISDRVRGRAAPFGRRHRGDRSSEDSPSEPAPIAAGPAE